MLGYVVAGVWGCFTVMFRCTRWTNHCEKSYVGEPDFTVVEVVFYPKYVKSSVGGPSFHGLQLLFTCHE